MKSLRLGFLAALSLVAGTISAFAAPATTSTVVNVRSGPGSNFASIATLPRNESVDVGGCSAGWCQITSFGINGWVSSQYLIYGPVAQPQPPRPQYPQPGPQYPQPGPSWPQPAPQWPQPQPNWPQPPRPPVQPPIIEDAGACFYSERNFGGASFCLDQGESLNSFRTWDNRIRSVEVFGGARVDLCSDRNLYGYCATLRSDTPRLPNELDRRASSVELY